MDDERPIREMIKSALQRHGYEVRDATNGEEAIVLYKAARDRGTPYHATIMDLTIPGGMGGREAAQKLLDYDPGAKIILSSGYSDDPVMTKFEQNGIRAVLAKPFVIKDLIDILQSILAT